MAMDVATYLVALGMAVLSGRITLIGARGGMLEASTAARAVVGALVLPCQIALIVWAFSAMAWYWAVVSILGLAFGVGLLVTRSAWAALLQAQPVIDLGAIAATIGLWYWFYPY